MCDKSGSRMGGTDQNKGAEYYNIITLEKSFHGRTLTTLAATGQEAFHKDFRPLTPGFVYTPANDAAALEKTAAENKCAAIMIEIVQGEGGVNALDADFVKAVFETAEKHGLLVITDEVQCGSGRTGELFGYMNYCVKPDIVTTAKGLAGGLPIGATLLGERAENIFEPGLHGSTFGGNPVSCSGAVNVLSRLTDCFLESVRGKGGLVRSMLSGAEGVESVSGMGLMIGIKTKKTAAEVCAQCLKRGVLVLTAKNKVRLLPPLNIETELLIKAVKIIKEVCAE